MGSNILAHAMKAYKAANIRVETETCMLQLVAGKGKLCNEVRGCWCPFCADVPKTSAAIELKFHHVTFC